jgi:hypothetical protein
MLRAATSAHRKLGFVALCLVVSVLGAGCTPGPGAGSEQTVEASRDHPSPAAIADLRPPAETQGAGPVWVQTLYPLLDVAAAESSETLAGVCYRPEEDELVLSTTDVPAGRDAVDEALAVAGYTQTSMPGRVTVRPVSRSRSQLEDLVHQVAAASPVAGVPVTGARIDACGNRLLVGVVRVTDGVRAELGTRFGDAVAVYTQESRGGPEPGW